MMKLCFVTVGATAPFPKLLDHVFTDSFFGALNASGFTHLMVQYGKDGEKSFIDFLERYPQGSDKLNRYALTIGGFDFEPSLERWFKMTTKSIQPERKLGLVISHAGTGSILDAMRAQVPLIIVPNKDLANNHQEELANELSKLGYAHKASPENVAEVVPVANAQGDKRPGTPAWNNEVLQEPIDDQMFWLD